MFQFSGKTRDEKEQLAIERRRQREQERRERILNPKVRTMGLDTASIKEQIREKEEAEELEKLREDMYARNTIDQIRLGNAHELQLKEQRRQRLKEQDEFRKTYQQVQDRKEYDLNDPRSLKNDLPARLSDNDTRNGASSMQKFHGEDLDRSERTKAQQEQMKQWVNEQKAEKKALKEQEKNEELLWQQREEELNVVGAELERKVLELRAMRIKHDTEFNMEHARSRFERERNEKINEEKERLEEINNTMNSEYLNEDYQTTINVNDPSRFIRYNFKALRPDQYEEIYKQRYEQLLEKRRQLEAELQEEEEWATQERIMQRQSLLLDRERDRQRKGKLVDIQNFQRQQSDESKERKKQMDEIYANRVTEDFFSQFQTSSR